ncbi:RNA polymerase sigma factor RpoE [Labilithrix luteola]|uniref:RNA polymerase sigma factor RpoE n=1 Tax=Labilithrix luteola TaxID=1391654 RepID=A0A0K1PT05_9BACT|nr:RNA polymerase sigma factor RpoE [Labilithrix luteola]
MDFRDIFREHLRFVLMSLRRLGVRDGDVEDVAQEVFVAVHRKLDDYDSTRPLPLWLFGFCLRAASSYRRLARHRRWQQPEDDSALEPTNTAPLPDDQMVAEENRRMVLAALDAIEEERRVVFVMHEMNDFPASQIAEMLNVPANTVYSRLRLAREEFRKAVHRIRASRSTR